MIGITGASGDLGYAAAMAVLRTADPREVVLTTRRPDALADFAAVGAQVRYADFDQPDTVTAALMGVDRVLLISTDKVGGRLEQHRNTVRAAAAAGVSHVVYTSVPEPVPGNPAVVVDDHAGTEEALRESGLRWTALRNHLYAHLQIPAIQQAASTGRFVTNIGDGRASFVTREDCAAAAAGILTKGGYEDTALDISGPAALGADELAALAGEIGGREVCRIDVDDVRFADGLRAAGFPQPTVDLVTSFGAATRGGFLASVTTAVADLTGRTPTPFAAALRAAVSR
ncbi:NAD(P)H-binding protein [Amycolatopsis sp. cmx-4-68]|uniref:NAD(P)H-binding protein n=1 Tax=Amycolatopsis sp. cmx-4-68 TaxID=2790938 RepID=UPI00397ADDDE